MLITLKERKSTKYTIRNNVSGITYLRKWKEDHILSAGIISNTSMNIAIPFKREHSNRQFPKKKNNCEKGSLLHLLNPFCHLCVYMICLCVDLCVFEYVLVCSYTYVCIHTLFFKVMNLFAVKTHTSEAVN